MVGFLKSTRTLALLVATLLVCFDTACVDGSAPFIFSLHRRITVPTAREKPTGMPTRNTNHLLLTTRGGGGALEPLKSSLVKSFSRVSESKTACWIILVSSILLEGFATSLSKNARDKSSPMLLLGALSVYIPW
eukprot:scaffold3505_cov170-Amphora_coffeaeformis.AAC.14